MNLYSSVGNRGARLAPTCAAFLLLGLMLVSSVPSAAAGSSTSTVSVDSQNSSGQTITGYRTVLYAANGTILSESFTPSTFTVTVGTTYGVRAESYGICTFSQWSDGVTAETRTFTATSSPVTFTAVYACAATTSTVSITADNQTGAAITGLTSTLYYSNGTVLQTGSTPNSFTVTIGTAYEVGVSSGQGCTFSQWSDGTTANPRTFTATSSDVSYTADFSCVAPTVSSVTIKSVNQFGNAITGYYAVLYGSAGSIADTGFTPATFNTTDGQSYSIQSDSYGNCTWTKWSDGVTTYPRPFTATSEAQSFTSVYDCAGASQYSSLTVESVNQDGNTVTGYTIKLLDASGTVVGSGDAPVTFNTTIGMNYTVEASGSSSCDFSFWNANTTTDLPMQFTAASTKQSTVAVYDCANGGSGTITIYDHRVPAGYWANCFATVCAAGTGPGATMYVALYYANGTLLTTGFANENGLVFSGLAPGATYLLRAEDCDDCHGSTHDVLFNHWGDGNTTDPIAVVAGSVMDAWYTCTNGCAGG